MSDITSAPINAPRVSPGTVFFIGAGMSAESGVPTYRGAGGIWSQYRYQDYACQRAFDRDPQAVLDFHELRRTKVLACQPHAGHAALARVQARQPDIAVITQNIDGLLQRAGVRVDAELHGSLWRLRCRCGIREDSASAAFARRICETCDDLLRPDITWFEDPVNEAVFAQADALVRQARHFIAIGCSGAVWPAAGFVHLAREVGAEMIEINPEQTEISVLFDRHIREPASKGLASIR
jgi:NAD-dependent deacetylase